MNKSRHKKNFSLQFFLTKSSFTREKFYYGTEPVVQPEYHSLVAESPVPDEAETNTHHEFTGLQFTIDHGTYETVFQSL